MPTTWWWTCSGRLAAHSAGDARAAGGTLGLAGALIAAAAFTDDAAVLTGTARDVALTPVRVLTY